MAMVGHIAQTGQIATVDFRRGNVPPSKNSPAFIKQCQQSLPAGYQSSIIHYCDEQGIDYAIRAKSSASMREQIASVNESDWQPLLDSQGNPMEG